jgi:hypothetical protein
MKTPLHLNPIDRRRRLPLRRIVLGMVAAGWLAPAHAVSVDSELVLLVDVSRPGLSNTEFTQLMNGYATAFTSTEILDSIQSGVYGRIAVSMLFFGNASTQVVGIPWMMIGNATQAQQFANLANTASRPFTNATPSVAAALNTATLSFGTETGGTGNGFESVTQIIEVASGTVPNNNTAAATATSSANAMASGVDLINSIGLGNRANAVNTFYTNNVIGSTIQGVPATGTTSPVSGTLASNLTNVMSGTVQNGANASVAAVPEPGTLIGLLPATLLLLRRRRK